MGIICLFFLSKNQSKVIFNPIIDDFSLLEVKGLYSKFASESDIEMLAMSNGVISRPTVRLIILVQTFRTDFQKEW